MFLQKFYLQDRVILGSDYPFPLGEMHPGSLIQNSESLTETEKVSEQYFIHEIKVFLKICMKLTRTCVLKRI